MYKSMYISMYIINVTKYGYLHMPVCMLASIFNCLRTLYCRCLYICMYAVLIKSVTNSVL